MAYKLAMKHFDIQKNAQRILQIYERHLVQRQSPSIGDEAAHDGKLSAPPPDKPFVRF